MDYELGKPCKKGFEIPYGVSRCEDDEEHKGRRSCGCGVWVLLVALVVSGVGCFAMMSTNLFNLLIQKNLTLRNNSMRFEAWKQPPVHALLRVYVFNYTNIEEFESGVDEKLKIEELGPYTYIETIERVNVTYNNNGTLTYKDRKTYKFAAELSNGSEEDRIVVPSIPFMAVANIARFQGLMTRIAIRGVLSMVKASPFIDLNARELLWGYNDRLSDLTSHILSFKYQTPFAGFGIFASKNRTQDDAVTIFTGEENVLDTGVIKQYGEKSSLDYWETEECNRIDGTDGTIYPPGAIKPNTTLYLYVKDMCRRVPMVYERSKVDQHGISVFRYRLARDIFQSGEVNPENRCFCNHGSSDIECMPSGVFNVSPCAYGGPIITSLPHFLYGDPLLFENFEGLSPDAELHESFVEIDPRLGIPLSGKSRFQLNVMVRKAPGLLKAYKDKLILPVSWMDYGVDRLPDDLSSVIYNLVLFIDLTETCLSFFFVVAIVVFFALIIKKTVPRRRTGLFGRNLDISTADMPLVVCSRKK